MVKGCRQSKRSTRKNFTETWIASIAESRKIHLFASLARKNLEILVYDEITEFCKPKVGVARLVS